MSHKRSNERLRGERLAGELWTALDSAAWQAEESRQEAWIKAKRAVGGTHDDFDIAKIIEDELRR